MKNLFKKTNDKKDTVKIKIPREIVAQSMVDYAVSVGLGAASAGTIYMAAEMEKAGNTKMAIGGYVVGAGAGITAVAIGVNSTRRLIEARKTMKALTECGQAVLDGMEAGFNAIADSVAEMTMSSVDGEKISEASTDEDPTSPKVVVLNTPEEV